MGSRELKNETAWQEVINNLVDKLTVEKFNAITKYTTTPLSIVPVSLSMMDDIYKVFEGRNASFSVDYPHERIQEASSAMLDLLNVRNWIEDKGKVVLKCAPNTVVVVDKDDQGDPKLIAVPNDKIIGYETNKHGDFTVFAFIHSTGTDEHGKPWRKYAVYDANSYRVVYEDSQGNMQEVVDAPHNLGYCPARFFYDNPLVNEHLFNRSIPLAPVRGVMKQWNQINLYEFYQDNFAAFQILEYPDAPCMDCVDGKIYHEADIGEEGEVLRDAYNTECQTCANKTMMGPGTTLGIIPSTDSTEVDSRNIIRFIEPGIESLKYTGEKQAGRENFIKINTVGYNSALSKEAMNESQVMAIVESRKKPLLTIASHLNALYVWITQTAVKVTYNVDVTVHANFGTEFFILSEKDILFLIQEAKKAGVQSTEIQQLNRQLIETKYKTSPHLVQKMLINADVEPNAYDTQEEARSKFSEGMITREDYYIKSNFTDLIGRFTRENGSVVMFGKEMPYDRKIESIKNTLLFYTSQKLPKDEAGIEDGDSQPTGASDTRAE